MKREFPPVYLALFLVLGCVTFRVLASQYPHLWPNISPLMAVAFLGAMYLPRAWGWLVGPATMIFTDIAFIPLNQRAGSPMFSWDTVLFFCFFAAVGAFGTLMAPRKSLVKIVGGSVLCSLLFYVIANTFAWAGGVVTASNPGYPQTFAGWVQANTVGLPGWEPTWHFLRNGIAGDLFFVFVLLLVLDRGLILGRQAARTVTHTA